MVRLVGELEAARAVGPHVDYDEGSVLLRRVESGEKLDIVILPMDILDVLAQRGIVLPTTIAKLGAADVLGIAVRRGEMIPKRRSVDGFRRWLLGVKSFVMTAPAVAGASSRLFLIALDRLGIADDVKPKIKLTSGGTSNAELVALGRAD